MQTIAYMGQSEARGRNRWFRIAKAVLTTHAYETAEDTRLASTCMPGGAGRSRPWSWS